MVLLEGKEPILHEGREVVVAVHRFAKRHLSTRECPHGKHDVAGCGTPHVSEFLRDGFTLFSMNCGLIDPHSAHALSVSSRALPSFGPPCDTWGDFV